MRITSIKIKNDRVFEDFKINDISRLLLATLP